MAGSKISRSPTRWSYEKEVGDIYCSVAIGASGAVSSASGGGVLSVTKEAADGKYSIALAAGYQKLLHLSCVVVDDAASNVASVMVFEAPATLQDDFKSDNTVTIQCLDFAGAAVNPTSGASLMVKLEVRLNSSTVFDGNL